MVPVMPESVRLLLDMLVREAVSLKKEGFRVTLVEQKGLKQ